MQLQRFRLLRDLGKIVFWFPVRWIVQCLPFGAIHGLGAAMGYVDLLLSSRARLVRMTANLQRGLGVDEKAARSILLRNLQCYCRNVLEFVKYPQIGPGNVDTLVEIRGRDNLDAALKDGRGAVLVTAHLVDKQLLQVALGHKGYAVSQINYRMPPDQMSFVQFHVGQKQRKRIDERIPVTFIAADGFMRPVLRCLKDNQVLIVAGDGSGLKSLLRETYAALPFLGQRMLFPRQFVSLARRTGAAALPAFAIQDGRRRVVSIGSPLDTWSGSEEDAIARYARVLEQQVLAYPFLWEFWEEFEPGHLLVAEKGKGDASLQ